MTCLEGFRLLVTPDNWCRRPFLGAGIWIFMTGSLCSTPEGDSGQVSSERPLPTYRPVPPPGERNTAPALSAHNVVSLWRRCHFSRADIALCRDKTLFKNFLPSPSLSVREHWVSKGVAPAGRAMRKLFRGWSQQYGSFRMDAFH